MSAGGYRTVRLRAACLVQGTESVSRSRMRGCLWQLDRAGWVGYMLHSEFPPTSVPREMLCGRLHRRLEALGVLACRFGAEAIATKVLRLVETREMGCRRSRKVEQFVMRMPNWEAAAKRPPLAPAAVPTWKRDSTFDIGLCKSGCTVVSAVMRLVYTYVVTTSI